MAASRTSCSGLAMSQKKSRKARPCRSTPRGSATTPPPWPSSSAMPPLPHVGPPPPPAPPLPGQRGPSGDGTGWDGTGRPGRAAASPQGRGFSSSAPRSPQGRGFSSARRAPSSPAAPLRAAPQRHVPLSVSQPGTPAGHVRPTPAPRASRAPPCPR